MRFPRTFLAIALLLAAATAAPAQTGMPGGTAPQVQSFEILEIQVEGVASEEARDFVRSTSGLEVGDEVRIPGSDAFSQAIRRLYRVGAYSDVSIRIAEETAEGLRLLISVEENMPIGDYRFMGVKDDQREELRNRVPLVRGRNLRESDVERSVHVIKNYFEEKGFLKASVEVEREVTEQERVNLTFTVDRGPKVEVGAIVVHGNEVLSDGAVAGAMDTKINRWWRVWSGETFNEDTYREDLNNVVAAYNEEGYYDARVLSDTTYIADEGQYGQDPDEMIIELTVHEGPQYHIRDITWEGNTVFSDTRLTQVLGIRKGDVFNRTKMQENLQGNRRGTDVSGLYMNRGYMFFNAQPTVIQAPGDSVDVVFDVQEGDIYEFGQVNITGNTKTKDHVIRRELYTLPGQTFSRAAIQRSIRQLQQLGYFSQQSLQSSPQVNPNQQDQTVDLTYSLEETGSDQLELSGGWGGGAVGLLLQASVTFNNFSAGGMFDGSAWRPIPAGDGQKLSLSVQMGGRTYQNYSLSFQEPWFRGQPNPVGVSLSHYRADFGRYQSYTNRLYGQRGTRTGSSGSTFAVTRASLSYGRRLDWPDDYFQTNWELGYQFYNVGRASSTYGLPPGRSQQVSLSQSLSRNSLDNPRFPTSGSRMNLSLEVAPPLGSNFIQYHKTELNTSFNTPLVGRLTFNVEGDWAYLGSLTGDRVEFERFMVGGTPLEARGFTFGKDLIFMRGYPLQSISPRRNNEAVGGTILNKYTAELRVLGIQSPQLQLAPYFFFDAANTWNGPSTYNPAQLYRSAGIGAKIFLPILGMVEVNYGRNLDTFPASGTQGQKKWRFQFSLGQGF